MIFHKSNYRPDATVILYGGKQADPTPFAEAYTHSRERTINFRIIPPSNHAGLGFQTIAIGGSEEIIYSDGLLLPPGATATIRSKDCAIVFLKNTTTGWGVLFHAGRPAMTPDASGRNIVDKAIFAVRHNEQDTLRAYLRGSICGRCFVHETDEGRTLIEPFQAKYSGAINRTNGGLDIPAIITSQLRQAGILPAHIDYDNLCTLEHYGLASHRGKDHMSNLVLVLN